MTPASAPLVSIIIPVYNCESYLAVAIESALSQDWENKEIIVVNDGSTDSSLKVIEAYAPRLVVINQENCGACHARNAGLERARGDYIQYLDQDDALHPQKISTQLKDLVAEPEGTLACGRLYTFQEILEDQHEFDFFDTLSTYTAPVDWLVWSFQGRAMQSSVWLVPRLLHDKGGRWNEELKSNPNDDGELFCRIILAARQIKFNGEAKTYFRMHEGPRGSRANNRTKIESLYHSIELSAEYLLSAEDSKRTRHAAACTFKHFAYAHCTSAPDLAARALEHIERLGLKRVDYDAVGGRAFQFVERVAGTRQAIRFKALLNSWQKRNG